MIPSGAVRKRHENPVKQEGGSAKSPDRRLLCPCQAHQNPLGSPLECAPTPGKCAPNPQIYPTRRVDLGHRPRHDPPTSQTRREGAVRAGHTFDPLRKSAPRRRPKGGGQAPPKEQPPWNLSGTRDRKGDDSLESEDAGPTGAQASTDGVGEAHHIWAASREISQVLMTDKGTTATEWRHAGVDPVTACKP